MGSGNLNWLCAKEKASPLAHIERLDCDCPIPGDHSGLGPDLDETGNAGKTRRPAYRCRSCRAPGVDRRAIAYAEAGAYPDERC